MEKEQLAPSLATVKDHPSEKTNGFSKTILPYLALVSGVLALSLSGLFIHWAAAPGTITSLYRMTVASIFLLPFVFRKGNRSSLPSGKLLLFPLVGGLFVALDHGFWSTSIGYTRIGTATLINNIAPLWVALFAAAFWKEKLIPRFWLGLAMALIGVVIVFGNDLLLQPHLGGGDFLALLSSFFYGAYFLITQRARQKINTLSYVWLVTVGGGLFLLVANLALGRPLTGYSSLTYLCFLGAGLVSQVIGYFSVGYALGHLPASVVSPSLVAQPVLTTLMAIPLAGEMLAPWQWIGGLIVLAGIYLVNLSRQTAEK
jgi:drug/metabolite transporter (DMT)-like permease